MRISKWCLSIRVLQYNLTVVPVCVHDFSVQRVSQQRRMSPTRWKLWYTGATRVYFCGVFAARYASHLYIIIARGPGCSGCKRNRSIVERWRCLAAARHLYSWHIERVRCRLRCVTWIHQDSARLGSAGMHADPYISHHHLYLGAIARERGTARLQQQNANSRFVFLSAARRSDSVSCLCVSLAG